MGFLKLLYPDILLLALILLASAFSSYLLPHLGFLLFKEVQFATFIVPLYTLAGFFLLITFLAIRKNKKFYKALSVLHLLRLKRISSKTFLISIGIFFSAILVTFVFNTLLKDILDAKFLPPVKMLEGVHRPSPFVLTLFFIGLVFGGVMEELFWRGYLMKVQEKKYGKKAWIINAVLWSLSHIVAYNPLKIIFIALSFSFIASKFKNTSITLIFHAMVNCLTGLGTIALFLQ